MPDVSIIVPIYNAEKSISTCLETIAAQSYTSFECICIDDGSKDDGWKVITAFSEKDHRFRCIHQKNSGPSIARNRGVEECKGKYILFVDADDCIENDYLEELVTQIEMQQADICCCGYTCITETGDYRHNDYPANLDQTKEVFLRHLFHGTGGTVCSKLYRMEVIRDHKIRFCPNYRLCEDQLFALEFYCKSRRFTSIDEYGYYYYKTESGISSTVGYEGRLQQVQLIALMENMMFSSNISELIINECMNSKFQNVIFGIMLAVIPKGKKVYMELLQQDDIVQRMKRLDISDMFSLRYILPLKMKSWFLTRIAYRRWI